MQAAGIGCPRPASAFRQARLTSVMPCSAARRCDQRQAVGHASFRSTIAEVAGEAPGLDLGQVQNVGHQAEQMVARLVDQPGIFLIARRAARRRSWCSIRSEKPIIAFSGVRSSWLILARNSDLMRLAVSAASLATWLRSSSRSSRSRSLAPWRKHVQRLGELADLVVALGQLRCDLPPCRAGRGWRGDGAQGLDHPRQHDAPPPAPPGRWRRPSAPAPWPGRGGPRPDCASACGAGRFQRRRATPASGWPARGLVAAIHCSRVMVSGALPSSWSQHAGAQGAIVAEINAGWPRRWRR